jgi:hypothetical protein
VPDSEATERALMFLPALLPAGIEPADPMISGVVAIAGSLFRRNLLQVPRGCRGGEAGSIGKKPVNCGR